MKLLRAEFTNFRILRDLILDFSSETEKRLVVVRAENESGKTTILNGLQWALYGDDALPGRRRDYRLHPIDWNGEDGESVPIVVEIDFETTSIRHSQTQGLIENKHKFTIIRATHERVRGESWESGPTTVRLFQHTERGSRPIEPPEASVREELPPNLREIFFTDGDRALSFIEADVTASTKQARVRSAIESLLGLDVINGAIGRVKRTATDVNRKVRNTTPEANIANIAGEIADFDDEQELLEKKIQEAKQGFEEFDERFATIEKRIEDILAQGNAEELNRQIRQARGDVQYVDEQLDRANRSHIGLLRSLTLSRELMAPAIESSISKLDELRDQGKIPNSTIPVLEERLNANTCICGEHLSGHDSDAARRRDHIRTLIDSSRRADDLQSVVTDLYYASQPFQMELVPPEQTWASLYDDIAANRDDLMKRRENAGRVMKALEAMVAQIPDSDLQGMRQTRNQFRDQRDRFNRDRSRFETELANVKRDSARLQGEYRHLLSQQERGIRIMADLEVAQDILNVLENAYQRLTTEELEKVSTKMNDIFLEMIGADPSQGAIIRRAEITTEFEITVYGPDERPLNPDRDLNGASRRALTLAFILALTRVSEVEAPNVIDTPLGMMSGYVKSSVLTTAIRESSQLVLFLTRSEIADCETILDREAAKVITLTNPAHFPTMLANEPPSGALTILKCACDHRQECNICQRVAIVEDVVTA